MKIIGVIPARYASTRMPGKPIANINGKPMIWWVYNQALKCKRLDTVVIATDDKRIVDVCNEYSLPVIMTRSDHDTPTSRLHEVSTKIKGDLYLLIMGDEPLINAQSFSLILPNENDKISNFHVAVLTNTLIDATEVVDFSNQKVVSNTKGHAMLISRSPIPYPKGTLEFKYEKVTGIQLFSVNALNFFVSTKKSILEKAEENDLMRFIENDIPVKVINSPYKTVSVDTPKDLEYVKKVISERENN